MLNTVDAIMKRKLSGFLYIIGIQYITGKFWILLVKSILYLER